MTINDIIIEHNNARNKPKYPQPHNIKIPGELDVNFKDYLIVKAHGRLKYAAKYDKSKQSKRLYR